MTIAVVGIVGVPFGLIASGFTDVLKADRLKQRERRMAAALKIQRVLRGHLVRRRFRLVVVDARTQETQRLVRLYMIVFFNRNYDDIVILS